MATSSISYPFPETCRPLHAHDASSQLIMEDENKQDFDTFVNHEEYEMLYESEEVNNTFSETDDVDEQDEGRSQEKLRRFRENLGERGHIMYKKLRFKFGESLHDFKGSLVPDLFEKSSRSHPKAPNDHIHAERGIDIGDILSSDQGGMGEPKLERFKVKTVNIAGVGLVKEED